MTQYVLQIDTTTKFVDEIPTNAIAVMGYDTGAEVAWTVDNWARFPVASKIHVDQSPGLTGFANGRSQVADVESGAATLTDFIDAAKRRQSRGQGSCLYISADSLGNAKDEVRAYSLSLVRYAVADYNFSAIEAISYLEENTDTVMVQFASPGSNPRTLLPGSFKTLSEANCDLSVKRADWYPAPGIAAITWTE